MKIRRLFCYLVIILILQTIIQDLYTDFHRLRNIFYGGFMIYSRQLDVRYTADVLVVGGGASGVSAAVAAARLGKKVLLCEAGGCFGGVGTTGLVPAFAPFTDGVNVLAAGIGLEIRKNVSAKHPVSTYWTSIDAEELKREYDRIVTEAGVDFLFFTTLCDVVTSDGHVEYAGTIGRYYKAQLAVWAGKDGDGDTRYFWTSSQKATLFAG